MAAPDASPPEAAPFFKFYTRLHLRELTGLRARNLEELVFHIKTVPGSVIYHHTHHFLQQHQYLSPEPPNDFAYWVSEELNEPKLGEKLSSINTCEFGTIRSLREAITASIEEHLKNAKRPLKEAGDGREFHFIKAISFILPTPYTVRTLEEFSEQLRKISLDSIYFHMFEARLRLERATNDFSFWLETSLAEKELARKIAKLDPYTYTMDGLRQKILQIIEARLRRA